MTTIRDATEADIGAIVALNTKFVTDTSPMDEARYAYLYAISAYCLVLDREGTIEGFVLAMREGQNYDSDKYGWFDQRFSNFIYIDRIVIDSTVQGAGLGGSLYDEVVRRATVDGCLLMIAEVNSQPRNERSLRFHKRYGFAEIQTVQINADKAISMQLKCL